MSGKNHTINNFSTQPAEHEQHHIAPLFHAPRPLVFAAWTDPEHLERWQYAPQRFTITAHESDILNRRRGPHLAAALAGT